MSQTETIASFETWRNSYELPRIPLPRTWVNRLTKPTSYGGSLRTVLDSLNDRSSVRAGASRQVQS
jgi:hypothetical protein